MNNEYFAFVKEPINKEALQNRSTVSWRQIEKDTIIDGIKRGYMKGYLIPKPRQPERKRIYLIGSLRNAKVAELGNALRKEGYDIFDDWHAAGPEADDYWQKYEIAKGNNFRQALAGAAAQNVFNFDKRNLDASDGVVMVMPAGKSGHLELGYMAGKGKKTCIFMDGEPERFDVMYNFADYIALSKEDVIKWAKEV